MRYLFISLSILIIWFAIILIATFDTNHVLALYFAAQFMTLVLFFIGFYRK